MKAWDVIVTAFPGNGLRESFTDEDRLKKERVGVRYERSTDPDQSEPFLRKGHIMATRQSTAITEWVNVNQGQHVCQCGCGVTINIARSHFAKGVPKIIKGHGMPDVFGTPEERFWSHVTKSEGCWLWSPTHPRKKYGTFQVDGKAVIASRFSWELHVGTIPDGLDVLHHCDTPACVNPAHLFLGTDKENAEDCVRKGRRPRGEGHVRAKLTYALADEIRAVAATGTRSLRAIARDHRVCHHTVRAIVEGRRWVRT